MEGLWRCLAGTVDRDDLITYRRFARREDPFGLLQARED
jgi:hypothetical protein